MLSAGRQTLILFLPSCCCNTITVFYLLLLEQLEVKCSRADLCPDSNICKCQIIKKKKKKVDVDVL